MSKRMSNEELAELRWKVRGKILDELIARRVTLTNDVVITVDVMLDIQVAFEETDRLNELAREVNNWEWKELLSSLMEVNNWEGQELLSSLMAKVEEGG